MISDAGRIKFNKDFTYEKLVPTLVTNSTGGQDELARWVLDWNGVLHREEAHAPGFSRAVTERLTGNNTERSSPVLIKTDALVYTAESIVRYLDMKSTPGKKLIPTDNTLAATLWELFDLFIYTLDEHITHYVYAQMLPNTSMTKKVFSQGAPLMEKLGYQFGYTSLANRLIKESQNVSGVDSLVQIKNIFTRVDALLSDGRKYLLGDNLSLADFAFSSIASYMILPAEFGGTMPTISQVPEQFRNVVTELRTTPAGQFVLRLYYEHRMTIWPQDVPEEPNVVTKLIQKLEIILGAKKANVFYFLQNRFPILRVWFTKILTVNKNDLLVELLQRDQDFTIEEINAKTMAHQKGAFFLGMDRMNPQFDRERNFVRKTARKEDLELIRSYVRQSTEDIIAQARVFGKLDVADSLCRVVLVRFISTYFGVPGPRESMMQEWLRALFYDLFLNFSHNKVKHHEAIEAANERKAWLQQLIMERKQDLKDGKSLADNILNRMILMQAEPGNEWFDDDTIQRNMGGLITGILETTNKAVILVLDELFNRPEIFRKAIKTAISGDMKKMYGYVSEALRFNPAQPGVIRYSVNDQILKGNGTKEYKIPANSTVFALTAAAMFDPEAFPDPKTFNPERNSTYMNYGFALHECYGKYINEVTISEFVAAVLRLENVQRLPGRAGSGTGLHIGPFPNNFVVTFGDNDD